MARHARPDGDARAVRARPFRSWPPRRVRTARSAPSASAGVGPWPTASPRRHLARASVAVLRHALRSRSSKVTRPPPPALRRPDERSTAAVPAYEEARRKKRGKGLRAAHVPGRGTPPSTNDNERASHNKEAADLAWAGRSLPREDAVLSRRRRGRFAERIRRHPLCRGVTPVKSSFPRRSDQGSLGLSDEDPSGWHLSSEAALTGRGRAIAHHLAVNEALLVHDPGVEASPSPVPPRRRTAAPPGRRPSGRLQRSPARGRGQPMIFFSQEPEACRLEHRLEEPWRNHLFRRGRHQVGRKAGRPSGRRHRRPDRRHGQITR